MSAWSDVMTATLAVDWRARATTQLAEAGLPSAGLETADPELSFAFLEDGRLLMPIGADTWVMLRDPDNFEGRMCCPAAMVAHILPTRCVVDLLTMSRRIRTEGRRGRSS